jgi:uncharacterized protein (DUF885 family)
MKPIGILMLSLPLTLFCLTAAAPAEETEDAKLTSFFKAYLEDLFRQRPMEATILGDHRFDDKLEDVSAKARASWTDLERKTLDELPKLKALFY